MIFYFLIGDFFAELYRCNLLYCFISFVLIKLIVLIMKIRGSSTGKLFFFNLLFFIRSFGLFFHEKLLLQRCTFDNLFNCLIELAEANKMGTAGADRLPFVPRKTYELAESSEAFNITCCQFSYYRKTVRVRLAFGISCVGCFFFFFSTYRIKYRLYLPYL